MKENGWQDNDNNLLVEYYGLLIRSAVSSTLKKTAVDIEPKIYWKWTKRRRTKICREERNEERPQMKLSIKVYSTHLWNSGAWKKHESTPTQVPTKDYLRVIDFNVFMEFYRKPLLYIDLFFEKDSWGPLSFCI